MPRVAPWSRVIGFLALFVGSVAAADVTLPRIFSDSMVLQRSTEVVVWGWAKPNETITITPSWSNKAVTCKASDTKTGETGRFEAKVPTPGAGGPFTLSVSGDNTVIFKDVMIGEVWLASGQSNMEWPLAGIGDGREGVPSSATEIAAANHPDIRIFTVKNTMSPLPRIDCQGGWTPVTPDAAPKLTAVGYFFARALREKLDVPIGIIDATWGGTPAESWASRDALATFPEFTDSLALLDALKDPNTRGSVSKQMSDRWWAGLDWRGEAPVGGEWHSGADTAGWEPCELPGGFTGDGLEQFDGVLYFRRDVNLPANFAGAAAVLELGPIDDRDDTFVNGVLVGGHRDDGKWSVPRKYAIPAGVLKPGTNTIAVRVLDTAGPGGFGGKPDQMKLVIDNDESLPLAGEWLRRKGLKASDLPPQPTSDIAPGLASVLYNGMIAPITPFSLRGTIWYQGESNVGRAKQYQTLFPALIADWRARFRNAAMPFYFVQIAPFEYPDGDAAARLREAQMFALTIPHTGMVSTMDLGNPKDIHPDNKQEVGRRLAAWALAQTYGGTQEPGASVCGPLYRGHTVEAGAVRCEFAFAQGLRGSGGAPTLEGFLVAGDDQKFFEADATIDGERVVVSSPRVLAPVAVRYGWSASPTASLLNAAGLPASSFRTDDWDGPLPPTADAGKTKYLTSDPDFKPMFDGATLSGWTNVNGAPTTWTVRDSMIVCTGFPTCVLRSPEMHENFVLELEFRHLDAGGNAGLFVWSDPLTAVGQPFTRSVEVQVMDGREADWYTSDGDIFPIHGARMTPENGRGGDRAFPTEKRMNRSPAWNHYRVECTNGDITLAVNGKVVTRGKACSPRKGFICLESEGSQVHFRNVKIKSLPDSGTLGEDQTANGPATAAGFVPLYNGVDLAGWNVNDDAKGHWTPEDWTLTFDGKGGDLWTTKSYRDFELIADWRFTATPTTKDRPVILANGDNGANTDGTPKVVSVPDAGDSGIYLRGSSKSQVNIWCWPIGSGEVYGYRTDATMPQEVRAGVTPKARADNPIGAWNRFHITMKGDRLTVNLNGVVVIDQARLPGVAVEGPIALQNHGDPVQFANIFIRELPPTE